MLIYCNGDSFTAGSELADYLLDISTTRYQNLGHLSRDSTEFYTARVDNLVQHTKTAVKIRNEAVNKLGISWSTYINMEKEKAWPAALMRIDPSIEVINESKSGASMGGILHKTVFDLLELKNNNKVPDIIFIQLTAIDRMVTYDAASKERFSSMPILHYLTNGNELHKKLATAYIENYKDSDLVTIYLYNLLMIDSSVKGITSKTPIYLSSPVSSADSPTMSAIMAECSKSDSLQHLYESSNLTYVDFNNKPMDTIHIENNYLTHILGHVEVRTHNKFAEEIYNSYIKPILIDRVST